MNRAVLLLGLAACGGGSVGGDDIDARVAELEPGRAVRDLLRADRRRPRGHADVHVLPARARFFDHVDELVAAGGAGMTFGTGAGGQTNLATDGDQLKTAAIAYMATPYPL